MAIKPLVDAVAIALGAAEVVSRAATISAQRNPLRPPTSRKAEPIRPAEPAPKPRQEPVKDAPSWRKEAWPAGPARHPIDSKTPKDRRPFEASLASQPASAPAPSTSADVVQKSSHTFVSENPAGNEAARTEVKLDVPPLQTRPSSSPVDSLWLSSSPTTEGTSLQPPAPSPASSSDPVASSSKSLDPEAAELIKAVARERFVQDEASRQAETLSKPVLRASKVPSSRIGRLFHYGGKPFPDALARLTHADRNIRSSGAGLAAGLGWGMASEAARRSTGAGGSATGSLLLSEANVKRLVAKLSRMRGAALKLGQFMSIQDAKVLPPQIEEIFVRVQNAADYMPFWQTEKVLAAELGADWRSRFSDFSDVPMAAASIGQVHSARLPASESGGSGQDVAVKVQFPGVYQSISSDLSYLSVLVSSSAVLPKGLFLENTMKVLGQELRDECDYRREAWCGKAMGRMLDDDPTFRVPKVYDDLSSGMVLTAEYMKGTPLTKASKWSQNLRNQIGHDVLRLCLREILHFRLMQTDPNWTNFLWNWDTQQIELIDFGATREYSEAFVAKYLDLLSSAIADDHAGCVAHSREIGYLTGEENETMVNAHVDSLRALAEPFRPSSSPGGKYAFAEQTITDRVRSHVPAMVHNRLTPPPTETYSLNRKLSGAFLLLARLEAEVDCRGLLEEVRAGMDEWRGPGGKREKKLEGLGRYEEVGQRG